MKTITKHILLLSFALAALASCKKDDANVQPIYVPYSDGSVTDQNLNGVLQGKVTGFTGEDSTAFSFSYLHPYEGSIPSNSTFYYSPPVSSAKVSATGPDAGTVDIYVERYSDYSYDNYSYLEIDDWDLQSDITDAYIEVYVQGYIPLNNGKTLYYYHYAYEEDITVKSFSFDKNTGDFSIELKASFDESTTDGTTDNPGTITMSYKGRLYSGNETN